MEYLMTWGYNFHSHCESESARLFEFSEVYYGVQIVGKARY